MPDAIITSTESTFGTISGTFAADQSTISGTVTGIVAGTLSGSVGVPGPAGAPGAPGVGVPVGGTSGQFLQKTSGADYATDWVTVNLAAYAVKSNNLSDLTNFATARDNLSLGSSSTPTFAGVNIPGSGTSVANLGSTSLTINQSGHGQFTIQPSQGIVFPNGTIQTTAFTGVPADYITSVSSPLTVTAGNLSIDLSAYLTSATAASTYYPLTNPSGFITASALTPYLTTSAAASTYQTLAGMSSYLTTSAAASTYQTLAGMSAYLTTASAATSYYPLTGNPSGFLTSAPVTSVAGRTGAITLSNTDISGLGTLAVVNDAPSDGSQYARKNGAWDIVSAGASYISSVSSPLSVTSGNLSIDLSPYAPLASPVFTGDARAVTPTFGDNDTSVATTAFVQSALLGGTAVARNLEVEVRNQSGSTIAAGSIVYISGATGNKPLITLAQANNDANSAQTIGFVKTAIANNGTGYVIVRGELENIDTSALTEGVQLYLSPTTAGTWTTTKPSAPQHLVYVGIVIRSHPTLGTILVAVQNGYELGEIHDVAIGTLANNDLLAYESSTDLWKNKTYSALGLLTSTTAASTYYPLTGNPSSFLVAADIAGKANISGATFTGSVTCEANTNTFGNATGTSTTNIGTGVTSSTQQKTVNIGGFGGAGSGTSINIGTSLSGTASSNIVIGSTTGSTSVTFNGTVSIPAGASISGYATTASLASYAPLASPALTGSPTATTAAADTNSTRIATTAYVVGQAGSATPLVNGTAAVGTSIRYARQDHVHPTDTSRAALSGATFTGLVSTPASATGSSGFRIVPGVAPTTPNNGDLWATTTDLQVRLNGVTETVAEQSWVTAQGYITSSALTPYLTSATAASTYQTISGMSSYLTTASAASTYAPLASPTFTGTVTIPAGASISGYATTASLASYAPLASPALTGVPTAPTAANGTNTTQVATTAFVLANGGAVTSVAGRTGAVTLAVADVSGAAPLASPALTGTPTAPTAATSTNTTQVATTAYVVGQAGTATPLANNTAAVGTSLLYSRQDHVHPTDTTRAPLASPTFTGTVTIPAGASISGFAPLASPTFTGTPSLPTGTTAVTQTAGNNTTAVATTAFVTAAIPTNNVKAWVNFNGTGTVAIRAALNVSSITDNGIGDYTVNMTTALVDTNYVVVASAAPGSNTQWRMPITHAKAVSDFTQAPTTSNFRVTWAISTGVVSDTDVPICQVAVFR